MARELNKRKHHNWFDRCDQPNINYVVDGIDLNIYFLDNYEWKDDAMRQEVYHVEGRDKSFSILLEEKLYDSMPEYYNKESLKIMHEYYTSITSINYKIRLIIGVVLTMMFIPLLEVVFQSLVMATLGSMSIGFMYYYLFLYRNMQKNMYESRIRLREELVKVHGEKELDIMLDKLESYIKAQVEEN